jgi:hypothetical protein
VAKSRKKSYIVGLATKNNSIFASQLAKAKKRQGNRQKIAFEEKEE